MNVIITNGNAEEFVGRFDGKAYTFPPGDGMSVPEVVAQFLFGYKMPDAQRARILVRNGWQKNGDPGDEFGPEAAVKRLRKFSFKVAPDDAPRPKPAPKTLASQRVTNAEAEAARSESVATENRKTLTLPGRSAPLVPGSSAA